MTGRKSGIQVKHIKQLKLLALAENTLNHY